MTSSAFEEDQARETQERADIWNYRKQRAGHFAFWWGFLGLLVGLALWAWAYNKYGLGSPIDPPLERPIVLRKPFQFAVWLAVDCALFGATVGIFWPADLSRIHSHDEFNATLWKRFWKEIDRRYEIFLYYRRKNAYWLRGLFVFALLALFLGLLSPQGRRFANNNEGFITALSAVVGLAVLWNIFRTTKLTEDLAREAEHQRISSSLPLIAIGRERLAERKDDPIFKLVNVGVGAALQVKAYVGICPHNGLSSEVHGDPIDPVRLESHTTVRPALLKGEDMTVSCFVRGEREAARRQFNWLRNPADAWRRYQIGCLIVDYQDIHGLQMRSWCAISWEPASDAVIEDDWNFERAGVRPSERAHTPGTDVWFAPTAQTPGGWKAVLFGPPDWHKKSDDDTGEPRA